jgi:hypothetical protein
MKAQHQLMASPYLQRMNKYMPLAIVYFFINSLWLPEGLLFTTLLTPFFIFWLYEQQMLKPLTWFFAITIMYACIHFLIGVDILYYLRSYLLLLSVFIFTLAFYQFTKVCQTLPDIFRKILILNFLLLVPACIAFFIPGVKNIFWMTTDVSSGLTEFSRLKMFTYEASYYSLLLVPIAMYYLLKIILLQLPNKLLVLILVALPLALSFAFGTLLGLPLAIIILFLSDIRLLYLKPGTIKLLIASVLLIVLFSFVIVRLYPDNPFFVRLSNIFQGRDSSFRGRVFESIYLAYEVVKEKSLLFGAGLGQFKLLARDLMSTFYSFKTEVEIVRLSSNVSETLSTFGLTGLFFRFGAEIYLFFKTRVFANYYRLALFIFIFIYQFTGSYLMNISEYVIWVLAFSNVFPEFNKVKVHEKHTP